VDFSEAIFKVDSPLGKSFSEIRINKSQIMDIINSLNIKIVKKNE